MGTSCNSTRWAVALTALLFTLTFTGVSLTAEPYQFLKKWGSYGNGPGEFDWPSGVTVDGSGYVYVADHWNHRIQKFDADGAYLTEWGAQGAGDGQLLYPSGVAVDASGHVYVADRLNHRIQKFTAGGAFVAKWGNQGSGDGQFDNPYGVAVDAAGDVYVADTFNNRIQKFTSGGVFIDKWGTQGSGDEQFDNPYGVAAGSSGNVYVADTVNNRIQKFALDGTFLAAWGGQGSGDGEFFFPFGLAADSAGNIYVADSVNDRIQKLSSGGAFIAKWGAQGSGDGEFNDPLGVAVAPSGNIYVVDTFNDRIQKFGSAGANRPPVISVINGNISAPEGTTGGTSGTVSDPDGDPLTLSASIGSVNNNGDGTWSWTYPTTDGPTQSQTVTITAADSVAQAQATFELIVNNVEPDIAAISGPIAPVPINSAVSATATFTDPGIVDTHTAVWTWGDGSSSTGSINKTLGVVGGDHLYEAPGVYKIELVVTDKDGGIGMSSFRSVVVYDPDGGFVTGGGWIESPAGADTAKPKLAGKASFGFVSKYKKGAAIPTGKTEFQFKTGDLNFHSSSYDWLVISGTRAKYKGSGTINGGGDYGFMLFAADGGAKTHPDLFRIKIWDKAGDTVVYDNNAGAEETADPSTALGGGNIIIHK